MDMLKKILIEYGMECVDEKVLDEKQYQIIKEKINAKNIQIEKNIANITMKDIEELVEYYLDMSAYLGEMRYLQGLRDAGKIITLILREWI